MITTPCASCILETMGQSPPTKWCLCDRIQNFNRSAALLTLTVPSLHSCYQTTGFHPNREHRATCTGLSVLAGVSNDVLPKEMNNTLIISCDTSKLVCFAEFEEINFSCFSPSFPSLPHTLINDWLDYGGTTAGKLAKIIPSLKLT